MTIGVDEELTEKELAEIREWIREHKSMLIALS